MKAQDFKKLYTKQDTDETLTLFENVAGFSLIRLYPKETPYHKDGRRMFIQIAVLDRGFSYSVDMTNPTNRSGQVDYVITDGEEYRKKVTNFLSDSNSDEFVFDEGVKKIKHTKTGKELTLNEFVDILEKNHLSDRLFWKRKMNGLVDLVLKVLFWLTGKHYEKVQVSIDIHHFKKNNQPTTEEQKDIEPFFKYFYISKNLIFTILLLSFFVAVLAALFPENIALQSAWHSLFGEFSLSNPMVVLLFFLALFSSEKISVWLNRSIKCLLMPEQEISHRHKENFIERLHNYQYRNKFHLKLD